MTAKQFNIDIQTAYNDLLIENEWRKNRMLILAQELANAKAELAEKENFEKRNKVSKKDDTI